MLFLAANCASCVPAPTLPPDNAPPAVVLTDYLQALQRGDCRTATELAITLTFNTTNGDLCGVTIVSVYSISGEPLVVSENEVLYHATLTTSGNASGFPSGEITWFYTLQQQPTGAWRIVDGGAGTVRLPLPTIPTTSRLPVIGTTAFPSAMI